MGKCKRKAIQIDLRTFRHNQAYPKNYSHILKTLACLEPWYIQNPDIIMTRSIFRTLGYSQPWYIQNSRIFRTLAHSKSEDCSKPFCQTSAMERFAKIVNGCNYFCKLQLFSQYKLAALSTSRNKYHEIVTPVVVILCKKLQRARGLGTVNFLIYPLTCSNKLAYLHIITVVLRKQFFQIHEQDNLNFQQKP